MRSLIQFVILSLVILVSAHAGAQQSVAEVAREHIANKHYLLAISLLEADLKDNKQNINALHLLARAYELSGSPEEAKIRYQSLVDHPDADVEILFEYADFLRRNLDLEEAKSWFLKYAEFNPVVGEYFAKSCDYALSELNSSRNCDLTQVSEQTQMVASPVAPDLAGLDRVEEGLPEGSFSIKGIQENGVSSGSKLKWLIGQLWASDGGQDMAKSPTKMVYTSTEGGEKILFSSVIDDKGIWRDPRGMRSAGSNWSDINPTLTEDGNTLFFSSNRPGGYGGFDLYRSEWKENDWTEPENLGALINTPGEEITPHANNHELYFSSDWHKGLGGFDVFKVSQRGEIWSAPENLGVCVNSSHDELKFKIEEQNKARFMSNKSGNKDQLLWYETEQNSVKETLNPATIHTNRDLSIKSPVSAVSATDVESNSGRPVADAKKLSEESADGNTSVAQNGKQYYIQIAALSQYNTQTEERMKRFAKFGDVYRFETGDGINKIRVGPFNSLNAALAVQSTMKKSGHKNTFIVTENPQEKKNHLIAKASGEFNQTSEAAISAEGKYKIRVGEFKAPEWVDPTPIKDIGKVEHWTRSGWTILILGSFQTVYDANLALEKVRSRGYKEAYIVVEEDGKLYKY